jgi:hypothetical protein
VSGRMNWDRVNRENRAWREARRAPSGSWEPNHSWEPRDRSEVDRWPKTGDTDPSGKGTREASRQRRRRRERAQIRVSACEYGPALSRASLDAQVAT